MPSVGRSVVKLMTTCRDVATHLEGSYPLTRSGNATDLGPKGGRSGMARDLQFNRSASFRIANDPVLFPPKEMRNEENRIRICRRDRF
jgi:hypothetical protein